MLKLSIYDLPDIVLVITSNGIGANKNGFVTFKKLGAVNLVTHVDGPGSLK